MSSEQVRTSELLEKIVDLEVYYEEPSTTPQPCCMNMMTKTDKNKFDSLLHLTEHRLHQIVKWARYLPVFHNVETKDQILLLQNSWAELTCFGVIWRSRDVEGFVKLSFGKTIDMEKAKEMGQEENISRLLYICSNFRRLEVDQYEYVALKVLSLMLPDIGNLQNRAIIVEYRNSLLEALLSHSNANHPHSPLRFAELLLVISEVQREAALTRQRILSLPAVGMPQNGLLMELLQQNNRKAAPSLTVEQVMNVIRANYKHQNIVPQCGYTSNSNLIDLSQHSTNSSLDLVDSTTATQSSSASSSSNLSRQNSVDHSEIVGNSSRHTFTRQDSRVIVIKG